VYPNSGPAEPARRLQRRTRAEKQEETRGLLLDAAAEVFIERGIQGASIEEITARAGFTRGAFYSNFESKEQLFVELLQRRVYDRLRTLATGPPAPLDPRESLRWLAERLVEGYRDRESEWLFALWLECLAHAARHPEFRSLAATFWSGTRAIGSAQIEAAFDSRGARPPIEPKHLATAGIALDIGLAVQNLVDPDDVPLELYPRLYDLLLGRLVDAAPRTAGPG